MRGKNARNSSKVRGKFAGNAKGGTKPAFVEMLGICSSQSIHVGRITATEANARIKEEAVIERSGRRLAIKGWIAVDVGAAVECTGVAVSVNRVRIFIRIATAPFDVTLDLGSAAIAVVPGSSYRWSRSPESQATEKAR